ncbi:MAG: 1,4-alpha-glucan branching protein GlgB [Acidimicrobiia bacterium]|nr:1,4-alpha-glucan branching protein GlgB [Acidimicrobiia bacterium]MDH5421531.1 1,4-alpha-glucan branching protein GlgB [Acidimicrobiia bacterium]MDH5502813.1 1,4-alpha-glucan branching protein GlgB [Acidimicrobiia bacterium]
MSSSDWSPKSTTTRLSPAEVGPAQMEAWKPATSTDLQRFRNGSHAGAHRFLGAHRTTVDRQPAVAFAVWAPAATRVTVLGDMTGWDEVPLHPRDGIWEGTVAGGQVGDGYHYKIYSGGVAVDKSDPYGAWWEVAPERNTRLWWDEYRWSDDEWMQSRGAAHDGPVSIYEMHIGSWRTDDGELIGYRGLAAPLIEHITGMGFTHVEFLPPNEHPFGGSWGYQPIGWFAPASRWGKPEDFKYLIDQMHRAGIGVIVDWVPAHFAIDGHGLVEFDGGPLYEYADPRKAKHPDWGTYVFDLGRPEVRSFLLSSAAAWCERFHVDGLRVDAVASMLYLDYSRNDGEWVPNRYGGRENLEAIDFLRQFNDTIHTGFPGVATFAEESTAWPMVSSPTYVGGLGFDYKWDMGWMHDTLQYLGRDPIYRSHHHGEITFRAVYAFSENYTLPLSHDEVVHMKGSLLTRMPGDDWQRFANLRLLFAEQFTQPGKKLLFMGGEFGQVSEWDDAGQLDWDVLDDPAHAGILALVSDLARLYRDRPSLHKGDHEPGSFAWLMADDADRSVLAWSRSDGDDVAVAVFNFTPQVQHDYRLPVPVDGGWEEIITTDNARYGGSGVMQSGPLVAEDGYLSVTLPPLAALILVPR